MVITKNGVQYIIRKDGRYWIAEFKIAGGETDITGRFLTRAGAIKSINSLRAEGETLCFKMLK